MKLLPAWKANNVLAGYALVDDEDYEKLNKYRWNIGSGYLYSSKRVGKRTIKTTLHKIILSAPDGMDIDHIDGNKWNNQKSNLRFATRAENSRNQGTKNVNKKYKGVYFDKNKSHWYVQIKYNYKIYCLGIYKSEDEAALAYDYGAMILFQQFAKRNLPDNAIPDAIKQKVEKCVLRHSPVDTLTGDGLRYRFDENGKVEFVYDF